MNTTDSERWLPVVGYDGIYSVSSFGRVRRDLPTTHQPAGFQMKLQVKVSGGVGRKRSRGYIGVRLSNRGVVTNHRVTILVAEAFLGPTPVGMQVNHIDGDKANNRVSNLEYVSPRENRQHATRIGLNALGIRHGSARLTEDQVREIRAIPFNDRKGTLKQLRARLGISRGAVTSVRMGKTWRHIA